MDDCPMHSGNGQCTILGEKCSARCGHVECETAIQAYYRGEINAEFGFLYKRVTELEAERDKTLGWAKRLKDGKGA